MNAANTTLATLTAIGGTEWQKDSMHRVYFNTAQFYKFEVGYYGTGNISSAHVNDQRISNTKAKKISNDLAWGKVWFDMVSGKFETKNLGNYAETILANINEAIAQQTPATPAKTGKSQIMSRAWEIAREAAAQFGGKAKEFFAESLRQAWAETK